MQYEKNPLTPHLEIYSWQISSLLSITHRIIGVVNFISIILFCLWVLTLFILGENFISLEILMNSMFGKFIFISLSWCFSYHILNEIRHLAWDLGYGYDVKISKITGILTVLGSFILTILFYLIGEESNSNEFFNKKMGSNKNKLSNFNSIQYLVYHKPYFPT